MEPFNIMGDCYQVERKPTLKPPVVEILIFTEKTQMFQINGDLDLLTYMPILHMLQCGSHIATWQLYLGIYATVSAV